MSGFGRKGLATGDVGGGAGGGFGHARGFSAAPATASRAPGDDMSPELRAFLAEERARKAAISEPGLTEISAGFERPVARPAQRSGSEKSMVLAYVFWWFASPLAAHRFYLGAYQSAFAMLGLFYGGLAMGLITGEGWPAIFILGWLLWIVADIALIPGMVRRANEGRNNSPRDVFA